MAEKEKHVPLRKCIGCQQMMPKKELVRIVKNDAGIRIDQTGKADGRGAYICRSGDCLKSAVKSKRLEKVFHCQIPTEIYTELGELLSNMEVR